MTITKQDIERLEAEAEKLHAVYRDAREAARLKDRELDAAKLAFAQANPHPWVGKKVQRVEGFGYRGKTRTKRGVVAIYDPSKHRGLRGLSYARLRPGEAFVLIGAQSGAKIDGHRNYRGELHPGETDWELAE